MGGVFGLNILGQYVQNSAALISDARRLNPAAFLVMDNTALYNALTLALPNATAIYRQYHPLDPEPFIHWTPDSWLAEFGRLAPGGIVQVGNEPNGYVNIARQVTWYSEIMQKARARGIWLGVAAYGVGHPDESAIAAGAFDPLIRELADGYHLLLLHEYARESTVTERLHHIGRFMRWRDRARAIGVNAPRIVIAEYGRDNVAPGQGGGRYDGWRDTGWSETQYADFLGGAAALYASLGVPTCIFCYGRGAGDSWQSFNLEGANTLLERLVQMNDRNPVQAQSAPPSTPVSEPKPPNAGEGAEALVGAGLTINVRRVRATVNNTPIGTVKALQRVTWYPETRSSANGNAWAWVESGALAGWIALVTTTWDKQFTDPDATLPLPPVTPFKLRLPFAGGWVRTSGYGVPRDYDGDGAKDDAHEGLDFSPPGTVCAPGNHLVLAAADGVVEQVMDWSELKRSGSFNSGYGIYVKLKHVHEGVTYFTIYAHLSAPCVCEGITVKAGDLVGILGSTGNSTAPHLHFTVKRGSLIIDPTPLLGL